MRNRYQRPPPDPALLQLYLRDAQPTANDVREYGAAAVEARRAEAVVALLALARAELAKAGDPNRLLAMPFQLRQFLTVNGLRILTADNPAAALRHFLGQPQPKGPGRPVEDHAYRDLTITAEVAEKHANGMTLEAAYKEVNKQPGTPSVKRIEKIYLDHRDDLTIRAALDEWWRLLPGENDPSPEIEGLKTISGEQWKEYSALIASECPNGMTAEDNLELWSFVRRACFPALNGDLLR